MSGIIRVSGRQWGGHTVSEMITALASETAHAHLATRPLLVVRNGNLVDASAYGTTVIGEGDEITVMPFTAGG
jgi:sulfur carrier protein ThiS